jgi:hypothetical protein
MAANLSDCRQRLPFAARAVLLSFDTAGSGQAIDDISDSERALLGSLRKNGYSTKESQE